MSSEEISYEYLLDKLLHLPEKFNEAFWKKEYAKAKYIYDTALRVTGFIEAPQYVKDQLFGNYQNEENPIEALFNAEHVRKAYEMVVVRGHQDVINECYRRFGEAPRYYPEPRYPVGEYAKK